MYHVIFEQPWPWWAAGIGIGLVVVALAALANRPLSVTTGFGNLCALTSRQPYFQRAEFGASGRWRLELLAGIVIGAALSALLAGGFGDGEAMGSLALVVPTSTQLVLLGFGGIAVGFGARFAGGCTSGHSIVGTALLAPSSMLATMMFMIAGAGAVYLVHQAVLP